MNESNHSMKSSKFLHIRYHPPACTIAFSYAFCASDCLSAPILTSILTDLPLIVAEISADPGVLPDFV